MQKLPVRRCRHGIHISQTIVSAERNLHSSVASLDNRKPFKRIQIKPLPLQTPITSSLSSRDDINGGSRFRSHSPQDQFISSLNIKLCDAEDAAKTHDWKTFRTKFEQIFADVATEENAGRPVSYIDLQKIFTRYCMKYTKASQAVMPVSFLHLVITRSSDQLKDRLLTDVLRYMVSGHIPSDDHTLTLIFQRCAAHRALGEEMAQGALDETLSVLMHIRQSLQDTITITPTLVKRWISFYSTVGDVMGALTVAQTLTSYHNIDMDSDIYQLLLYACGRAASKDPKALENAYHIVQHIINLHNARPDAATDQSFAVDGTFFDNLVFGLLTAPFGTPRDLSNPSTQQISRVLGVLERIKVFHAQCHCPPPSVYIFESIISAMCNAGQVKQAYQLYKDMRRDYSYLLSDAQFVSLCTAVADTPELGINESAMLLTERISVMKLRIGPDISSATFGSFVDLCARYERLDLASLVLKEMNELNVPRDLVTYEVLVRIYGNRGDTARVLSLYHDMLNQGLQPEMPFYQTLVTSVGDNLAVIHNMLLDLETARVPPNDDLCRRILSVSRRQETSGAQWIIPLFGAILQAYDVPKVSLADGTTLLTSSNSQIPRVVPAQPADPPAFVIFPSLLVSLSARIWTEYMEAIAKFSSQPSDLILQLLTLMKSHKIPVPRALYRDLILGRVNDNDADATTKLLSRMIADNIVLDIDLVTSVARTAAIKSSTNVIIYQRTIETVINTSSLDKAEAYSILFKGLCRAGQTSEALALLDEMAQKSLTVVESAHLTDLVSSVSSTDFVRQAVKVYDTLSSYGFTPDSAVLLQMALKCHNSSDVALVIATKQSGNLDLTPLSYEHLLTICLTQSPVDMPLFNNVMLSMTNDDLTLSPTGLDSLFSLCQHSKLLDASQKLWSYADSNVSKPHFGWIVSCVQTAVKVRTQPATQAFTRTLLAAAFKADNSASQSSWPAVLNSVIHIFNARTGAHNAVLDVLQDCSRLNFLWFRSLTHPDLQANLTEALRTRLSDTMTPADWNVLVDCVPHLSASIQKVIFDCVIQLSEADRFKQLKTKSKVGSVPYPAFLVALSVFSNYSSWIAAIKQKLISDEKGFRTSFLKLSSNGFSGKKIRLSSTMAESNITLSPTEWIEICMYAVDRDDFDIVKDVFAQNLDWSTVSFDMLTKLVTRLRNSKIADLASIADKLMTIMKISTPVA